MRRLLLASVVMCVAGCATHLRYPTYADGDDIPANSLKFALQSGAVTLAPASPASGAGAGPSDACKGTKDDGTDCYLCFTGIKTQVATVPADELHVAVPSDPWPHFSNTKISGQPLGDIDTAYKQVTVT